MSGMKCKVCYSTLRKEIEQRIINGDSYKMIELFCKSKGEDISNTSIKRHNDADHIEGFKRVGNSNSQNEGLDASEVDSMVNDSAMCVEIPCVESEDELKSYTRVKMMKILANQQAIVLSKQESFMQGHGRYPQNEVQGLRTIIACLDAITDKGGKALGVDKLNRNEFEM